MIGETITIRRRAVAGEDSQGNPTYAVTTITVEGCAFAPNSSDEDSTTFGTRAITGGTVYDPSGTDFLPSDELVIRGKIYAVDGETGQWINPYTGERRGSEVAVKRGS